MKLRDLTNDGSLSLLRDIFRGYVTDPDLSETLLYDFLGLDMANPSIDVAYTRQITEGLTTGVILPGLYSALWEFVVNHHPTTAKPGVVIATSPIRTPPVLNDLPWEAGTEGHDFFLFLYDTPRTLAAVKERWEPKKAIHYWGYFQSDRIKYYGYKAVCNGHGDNKTLMLVPCEKTTTISST